MDIRLKRQVVFLGLLGMVATGVGRAQMMNGGMQAQTPSMQDNGMAQEETPKPDAAQEQAARTFALKSRIPVAKASAKRVVLTPLSQRERVQQLLDRFTFGPKPGEVDQVMAEGASAWLAQQMDPDSIKDTASDRMLAQYPTLTMTVPQIMDVFPDRAQVYPVMYGKVPYPVDPQENAVFEVQVYKLEQERDKKKADGSLVVRQEPTDAEKAAQKQKDQAAASQIAGELLAMPKSQRMAALIKMPVEDRIVFTKPGNLPYEQRNMLLDDFTPRERETFLAMGGEVNSAYFAGGELAQARITRDIMTNRQLLEVMTDFWFNHFNVYLPKDADEYYTTSYERDVIRKNALGTFPELLMATAKSPAMMIYLDNYISIGPDSVANGVDPNNPDSKKGKKGLNENYGREVMELHTVSVNGGYTQTDVTTLSAILTGWGVDRVNQGGGFLFDPKRHEPGPKTWFGYVIDDNGNVSKAPVAAAAKKKHGDVDEASAPAAPTWGPSKTVATEASLKQGEAALTILANSPKTAHFISWLLVQRFVADDPPPALVDRLTKVYLSSHGDIKTILRALIDSPEFNSKQYFHNKVKTPIEFVASAFRSTGTEPTNAGALDSTIRNMGMPMYRALPPTGYYLTAEQWMNSGALVDRLNFAYALTNGKFGGQKFDAPKLLAMGLLTPSGVGTFNNVPATKEVSTTRLGGQVRLLGVAAAAPDSSNDVHRSVMPGTEVAMRVLEATMIGSAVSNQTNELIEKQMAQQREGAGPTATLNLLTALVMGAPEFQLR